MPLDASRHHAMAISSLIKEDGDTAHCYLSPVMSPSLSSTTSSNSNRNSPQPFASAPRSKSSSSFFEEPTTISGVHTRTLLLDSPNRPHSTDERRRRNKEASARYRAKRNQRNEDMRNVVAKLIHQNNVLFTALQEAYEHQGRDAPRSMDEVFGLMNKTQQQQQQQQHQQQQLYTYSMSPSPSPSPSPYPSPLMGQSYLYPPATISSNH